MDDGGVTGGEKGGNKVFEGMEKGFGILKFLRKLGHLM